MACANCGHNDWVTIGNTKYCAHCGEPANAATSAPKVAEVDTQEIRPAQIGSVVAPQTAPSALPEPAPIQPATPAAPVTLPKPANRPRTMSDISNAAGTPATRQPNPAHSYHSTPATASAGLLDLRPNAKTAPTTPVTPAKPLEIAKSSPSQRLARAAAVPKSPAVQRFTPAPVAPLVAAPAAEPNPQPVMPPQPVPATPIPAEPTLPELPNYVATQLQSMQELIPPTATNASGKPTKLKTAKPPKALSIAAAGMTAAILAGYIWLNNYDSLTIRAAGSKAGIAASAPSYLPASYNLTGAISVGSGFVSMQYKSPSAPGLLTISQSKSSWTSGSLLELYVNQKSKSYLSVQSQGLTFYLLDNNQATWVNRGIQYVVQANSSITRDQLKIAESL